MAKVSTTQPPTATILGKKKHFTILDDLLLFDDRIVIPQQMLMEILDTIHIGHLGITKCRARARNAVYWPEMSARIEEMVNKCQTCAKVRPEPKEPLMKSAFPQKPWEKIGMDLCCRGNDTFLVVVDYYSRWIECKKLINLSSACVIKELKTLFCTHGIPEIIILDNGPQFSSDSFRDFGRSYGFTHVSSSLRHPSGNGESERAVRTVKEILKKNGDQYLALLTHHTTPLSNGLSLCELSMGHKLRTTLPILPSKLIPGVETSELERARERENHQRTKQQQNFNRRHRAKPLPKLNPGDEVWIRDMATVVYPEHEHSYTVATESGNVRRNRAALVDMSPRTPSPLKPPTLQKQ